MRDWDWFQIIGAAAMLMCGLGLFVMACALGWQEIRDEHYRYECVHEQNMDACRVVKTLCEIVHDNDTHDVAPVGGK